MRNRRPHAGGDAPLVLGQPGDTFVGVARTLYRCGPVNNYSVQPRDGGCRVQGIRQIRQGARPSRKAEFRRLRGLCGLDRHARTAVVQGRRFWADRRNGASGLDTDVSDETGRTKRSEVSRTARSRRCAARGCPIRERPKERQDRARSSLEASPQTPPEIPGPVLSLTDRQVTF